MSGPIYREEKNMFELIKKLTGVYGVSGSEEGISEVIAGEIRGYVDEIYNDALGNLIARKKGSGRKIMIAAHMDEIGVIATFIDDRGFIRFSSIGGVSAFASFGQKVRFKNGTTGAIAYEEKLEDIKNLKLPVMYIDIGAVSREDAESKVKIGDSACFIGDAIQSGDKIISKALE
jgi:endoglucanase